MSVNKVCEQCGETFSVRPRDAKQRFCKKDCLYAWQKIHGRKIKSLPAIEFTCQECQQPFSMNGSFVNAYRKKYDKDPMYCSIKCSSAGRKKTGDMRNKAVCLNCSKEFFKLRRPRAKTIYREQKYCSVECREQGKVKRAAERYDCGEYTTHVKRNGYLWISVPTGVTGKKGGILEHRYVMSRHIGRQLTKQETVHHIDGDRTNNELSNLELFSSRHGPGQRVRDKVAFAIEILRLYPEFGREVGVELVEVGHGSVNASSAQALGGLLSEPC